MWLRRRSFCINLSFENKFRPRQPPLEDTFFGIRASQWLFSLSAHKYKTNTNENKTNTSKHKQMHVNYASAFILQVDFNFFFFQLCQKIGLGLYIPFWGKQRSIFWTGFTSHATKWIPQKAGTIKKWKWLALYSKRSLKLLWNGTNIHITHNGIKLYCDQCDFQATLAQNLKAHKDAQHQGITANFYLCSFVTKWKSHLNVHKLARHDG